MSAYTLFANAFLAVGGFVVALFAIGAIVALGFHLYLAFEGFVAAKFAEDAFGHSADGDWPHVPFLIPDGVEPSHRSERNTL